ncbi:NF038143 family protein [Chloroflexota bacterium]
MRRILPRVLDTRFEAILAKERSLAKAVAGTVIGVNPVTAWDVVMPVLFMVNFLRYRKAREVFTLNFLFTKKLALEAAYDMIKKEKGKEEALATIEAKTDNLLMSDRKGIYSAKIRQRQMVEIELLLDHYCKLLEAEGKDYATLVKNAYQTRDNCKAFLERLKRAEKEVNRAARQTLGAGTEMISQMEKAVESERMAGVEKVFASVNR